MNPEGAVSEVDDIDAPNGPDMRAITRCAQNAGFHVYGAGPCFDTYEQAVHYRESLDAEGVTWRPQR